MKKILFALLFLGISSYSLLADRAEAAANAITAGIMLENSGYTVREIPGRYLRERHYRTYNRYLYAGNCYAIVGVGDNGVRDLDVYVWNKYWNLVAKDTDASNVSTVKICPRRSGTYHIRTFMYRGSGYFFQVIAYR